jgi:hypothetical protein
MPLITTRDDTDLNVNAPYPDENKKNWRFR